VVLPYIGTPARAVVMATTPLNVSASDPKSQTEGQGAGIEMQARLIVVDSDDAPVGSSDVAAGLADAQVQPSVFVASPRPTPSDAAQAEKRMLDAIGGALEQGPRAVVEAMCIALPRGEAYDKIYEFKSRSLQLEELPISVACVMDQNLAVISKLMEAFPDHVMKKDGPHYGSLGWTAVHWATRYNSNAAVILELLKAYPEAARENDEYGRLPLHWAVWNKSNVAVILELLKAYPEAARKKDRDGCLPLHVALGKRFSIVSSDLEIFLQKDFKTNTAVISELLKAYPEAAREKDRDGRLPLHDAAIYNSNAEVISELLKAYPEAATAAREKDRDGCLPLHDAASYNSNAAVISELLKAYPEAVREKKEDGRLPLHYAAKKNSHAAVILELLKAYPEAVREKDRDGRLPLHYAAENNSNAAVISELLKAYPEAVREKKEDGRLLLHDAARYNSNAAVISELLKAYPEAVREKDRDGCLPLHYAARYNSNAAVISELLKAYPEAVREKNRDGRLPLHAAFGKSLSRSSLPVLIFLNFLTDKDFIPNAAVILELLKAYPEAAREKDRDGRLPLHDAVLPLHDAAEKNSNAAVISELLKAYPEAVLVVYDVTKAEATLNKCLSVLSQAGSLPSSVIKSSIHPLLACLRLSAGLQTFSRRQRSKDIRLANDADEKAAELEQLACAIVRSCEDNSRFGQAMDDCLQCAADLRLKFFISEPSCSRRIEQLWSTTQFFSDYKKSYGSLVFYFFWTSGLNFVFNFPGLAVPPPLVRFLMNRASYFAFLVCLLQLPVLAAPGDRVNNIGLEVFLAYWLFDICFSEAIEFMDIIHKHRLTLFKAVAKYAEDPWNVYDVISLSAAVAAAFVRGFVHAGVGDVTAAASNQLYAWALALLWGRLVNVLSVVSFTGPLLIMVLVMVFRDLSKFASLVVLMELPFVAALYFLESGNGGNEAFATFPDSAVSFFKIVIGQGPDISNVTASSSVLLSIGSVLLSVLLLNLLIALFSKTFDTIVENSTQEYLLQKTQLTFTWLRAPRMPPPLACPLALRDWAMNMLARHVWRSKNFIWCCAGWDWDYKERVEPPPPTFDRKHFYGIVLPKEKHWETEQEHERNAAKREEWSAQWMKECDAKYEAWCKEVLYDLEANAEFNSEAQMEKFKSRMLRGMETTVESSSKIDQIAENAKATQEQVKALSDAVQQMHASMQLILQKLNT